MPAALRPLTTGQLLDRTFSTYRSNFVLFMGISALPNICLLVMQLALLAVTRANSGNLQAAVISTAFFGLGVLIVNLIVSAISTAATTFGVSDIYLEKPTSIGACFARVKGKIGRVIYVSLELGIRVFIGFILLIIPGFYWLGKYGVAVPAVVLEDIKAKKAFPRSADLTKDAVGRIITIYFLTWVLIVAISLALETAIAAVVPSLAKSAGTVTAQAFNFFVSSVVNTLITPVMAIAITLAYYDQRVRKEAFDIENLMSLLGQPLPPSSSAKGAGATV